MSRVVIEVLSLFFGGVLFVLKLGLEWRLFRVYLGVVCYFILACLFFVYRRKGKRFRIRG